MTDSREGDNLKEAVEAIRKGIVSVAMFHRREKGWEQTARLRYSALETRDVCLCFET